MASILPFIIFFLLPLLSSSSIQPRSDLITKTCNLTTYYDFCVSSLSSSQSNNNTSNRNSTTTTMTSLSTILINLAISNATETSSFASSLAKATANPSLASLFRMCSEKYIHSRESLQNSLVSISNEEYDYASIHVSAAAEYPNVCPALFRRSAGLAYPVEMEKREEVMKKLCAVALDIISLLLGS